MVVLTFLVVQTRHFPKKFNSYAYFLRKTFVFRDFNNICIYHINKLLTNIYF